MEDERKKRRDWTSGETGTELEKHIEMIETQVHTGEFDGIPFYLSFWSIKFSLSFSTLHFSVLSSSFFPSPPAPFRLAFFIFFSSLARSWTHSFPNKTSETNYNN